MTGVERGDAMGCTDQWIVRGLATWYCCGPGWGPCGGAGGGACGNCRSSSWHCAWPNASRNCHEITRPDRCGLSLPRLGCGHGFTVVERCRGACIQGVYIADCGPDTDRFCGQRQCCGDVCSSHRVLDLTPAAFARLADLDAGVIQVRVIDL